MEFHIVYRMRHNFAHLGITKHLANKGCRGHMSYPRKGWGNLVKYVLVDSAVKLPVHMDQAPYFWPDEDKKMTKKVMPCNRYRCRLGQLGTHRNQLPWTGAAKLMSPHMSDLKLILPTSIMESLTFRSTSLMKGALSMPTCCIISRSRRIMTNAGVLLRDGPRILPKWELALPKKTRRQRKQTLKNLGLRSVH